MVAGVASQEMLFVAGDGHVGPCGGRGHLAPCGVAWGASHGWWTLSEGRLASVEVV